MTNYYTVTKNAKKTRNKTKDYISNYVSKLTPNQKVKMIRNQEKRKYDKKFKEFIRRLKEEIYNMKATGFLTRENEIDLKTIINKLAGKNLSGGD